LGKIGDITNYTNVLFATPFAVSTLLPPELLQTIQTGTNINNRGREQ
jgi:hypothetical protein